jgi:glycogen operon protein
MLTTLFLSQGVPMLLAGDELGRSQRGNNNAYCQDNEISWIDWATADHELVSFVARLSALRHRHPIFRRRRFFEGQPVRGDGGDHEPDISWFTPGGTRMSDNDWRVGYARTLAVFLNGAGIEPDPGTSGPDDSFVVLCNANRDTLKFTLAPELRGETWRLVLDSSRIAPVDESVDPRVPLSVPGFSVVLLRRLASGATPVR